MSDDELLDSLDRELLLGLCDRPADCPNCRERWSKIEALRRLRTLTTAYLAEHPADAPKIGNAIEALKRFREAGCAAWDNIDDPEEYLGRRDHPPLTRERVAAAVGELMDGIRGATGGHEPFDRVWLTDRLCRLMGVTEE